jgi:hypothetical protein
MLVSYKGDENCKGGHKRWPYGICSRCMPANAVLRTQVCKWCVCLCSENRRLRACTLCDVCGVSVCLVCVVCASCVSRVCGASECVSCVVCVLSSAQVRLGLGRKNICTGNESFADSLASCFFPTAV